MRHFLKLMLALLSLTACELDLPVASRIEHMRVLTAIAEVEGDSERSSPAPGETARVTWAMAYPDVKQDDSELSSLFYVCTAPTRFAGAPICQEFIDAADAARGQPEQAGAGLEGVLSMLPNCANEPDGVWDFGPLRIVCVTGTPKLDIKVPDSYKAKAQLMQGVICRNGTPRVELKLPPRLYCDSSESKDAEEIAVYGTVPVQHGADTENHNPSTDAFQLSFHEPPIVWEPSDEELDSELSDEACADLASGSDQRVMSSDGNEETITIGYDADAREEFEGKPEPLTFSTYTTFGSLSNRFSVFRSDAKLPFKRTITWELSDEEREQLKKSSKYVRFYFTVLDGRGGYAITHRDLCVIR